MSLLNINNDYHSLNERLVIDINNNDIIPLGSLSNKDNSYSSTGIFYKDFINIISKDFSLKRVNTINELKNIKEFDKDTVVNVLGYNKINDLGGGLFYWNPTSTALEDNGLIFKSNHTSTGRWYRVIEDHVSPEMFGAIGDGVTKDTEALQSCLKIGGNIKLTQHYLLDIISGTQSYYNFIGSNNTILDFSQNTDSTHSIDFGDFQLKGEHVQIPNLASSPQRFTNTLTFSSAHNLVEGDIFTIWNSNDFSWSPARAYYKAGEMCEVKEVISPTEVEVYEPLYDAYDHTLVTVYKLNPVKVKASGFTIIGGDNYGLQITAAKDIFLENLNFSGSFKHTLNVSNAYNVSIDNIRISHTEVASLYNYGLLYGASQNVSITNCTLNTISDAIESGSGIDAQGIRLQIPTRRITIKNIFTSDIISQHGHAEYTYISNCFCNRVVLGGDRGHVENCYVSQDIALAREGVGMNFTAKGNTVKESIYYVNQISDANCRYPDEIQKIRIQDNTIEEGSISLKGIGTSVNYELHLYIEGNKVIASIVDDQFYKGITTAGNSDSTANYAVIKNNDITGYMDIRFRDGDENTLIVENNTVRKGGRSSLIAHQGYVFIKNNLIIDTFRSNSDLQQDTNLMVGQVKKLYLIGNTFGDTVPNNDGDWITFNNTSNGEIYMYNNDNLNQPSKSIYFNPSGVGSTEADIKPYFTGRSNPQQGKAVLLTASTSVTISGLELGTNYLNIQLTGTTSETANAYITNITTSSFDITVDSAVSVDSDVYWKLEG